eukprot:CAMPEP_0181321662 /NCGR_PEP_ID=MMETSP1101-20121128/18813_1 /TAXON_ID=46948 /ORGANISM="Rhodomonas abbreviata, Strain Caron Lab Isolate" /LENGTH=44 /DNA_ID= /DNA_START= /DNA_END= /DNA_ORIENTATION=
MSPWQRMTDCTTSSDSSVTDTGSGCSTGLTPPLPRPSPDSPASS